MDNILYKDTMSFEERSAKTQELINNIVMWGRKRHINNIHRQLNHAVEELGELAHEVNRDNYHSDKTLDALGDTLVTLIIAGDILGYNTTDALMAAYEEIKDREGVTSEGTFIKNAEKD